MQVHRPEHSPDSSQRTGNGGNNIKIDLGGMTLIAIVMFSAILGVCGMVIGLDVAERSRMEFEFAKLDRQYRMVELKLDDWTVVAHRSGLVLPSDYVRGPQGNPEAESFQHRSK